MPQHYKFGHFHLRSTAFIAIVFIAYLGGIVSSIIIAK